GSPAGPGAPSTPLRKCAVAAATFSSMIVPYSSNRSRSRAISAASSRSAAIRAFSSLITTSATARISARSGCAGMAHLALQMICDQRGLLAVIELVRLVPRRHRRYGGGRCRRRCRRCRCKRQRHDLLLHARFIAGLDFRQALEPARLVRAVDAALNRARQAIHPFGEHRAQQHARIEFGPFPAARYPVEADELVE